MYETNSASFFLGANTPGGFVSFFDELYIPEEGWKLYIIKGGPGTGKSTFLKKAAAEADRRGLYCERIWCSSDPKSLDAVIIPRLKVSLADGTPPHAIEPRYPGVSEVILDLGAFRDDEKLRKNADAIIRKTKLCSGEHKKCVSFLSAAKSIDTDTKKLVYASLRREKLVRFASRLAQTEFGCVSDKPGRVHRRFLSALTPLGNAVFTDTFLNICEKRVVLEDNFGVASAMLIGILRTAAAEAGLDCICCPCPTDPALKPEHLMIPALSLGFFTSNARHPYEGKTDRTVDCKRFLDNEMLKEHKNRLAFNRRARNEMIDEAVNKLISAKKLHDEIEKYYVAAMDFDEMTERSEKLLENVFKHS